MGDEESSLVVTCHHPDNIEPEVIENPDEGSCKGFVLATTVVSQ